MPCGHINAIRNIKKYQNKGRNLPALETKVGSTVYTTSNSYPKDKCSNKFNFNRSKMYLNNYVIENEENVIDDYNNYNTNDPYFNQFNINHQNDSDYDTFGIAEEEDIEEIENSYNKRLYRDDKEIEKMFESEDLFNNNNLNKTQTIDLQKLSKTISKIKDLTGEDYNTNDNNINNNEIEDDGYEWLREKLPKPCYN